MDKALLITGGFPYPDKLKMKQEGYRYKEAFICEMDPTDGQITRQMQYVSPSERIGPHFSMQFKFGQLYEDKYIFPTSTEVVFLDKRDWTVLQTITHPTFNDLHCIAVFDDKLYVVNTGVELIQIFTLQGELKNSVNVAATKTWDRFDPQKDYRFVATTKPHQTHANFLFFLEDKPWITRFEQRDAIALFDASQRIDLGIAESSGKPHDGLVRGDYIYFTMTDGFVIIVNRHTCKIEQIINFNALIPGDMQPGWCRGIEVCDGLLYVGFSQLRHSKFVEYGSWIKHGKRKLPARVCVVDPEKASIVKNMPLTSNSGAAIFGIMSINP